MSVIEWVDGSGHVLILCDHASNRVPDGVDLGIDPALLDKHIALDIGAVDVSRGVARRLDAPAMLATVSRLVIDLNREVDAKGLIPKSSDGHKIPGNEHAVPAERIARFHAPYHREIAAQIKAQKPRLLLSIHSFTPALEHGEHPLRPWESGILYNRDARAAQLSVDWLRGQGYVTGDNEPYSGRVLNATMNRHAEANGIPYIGVEIRNDLISDAVGIEKWADILANLVSFLSEHLALETCSAT